MISTPTCRDLYDGDLKIVYTETIDGWRRGVDKNEVYYREKDDTYWSAWYRVSTDGETNELREGDAEIGQVKPYQKLVTRYSEVKL